MPKASKTASSIAKKTAAARPAELFVSRERLFSRLDELAAHAVWLQGPTGAGKTVLLRTYLQRSALPTMWLAIDSANATPDVFFAELLRAAERAGIGNLPAFAGEHRQAPEALLKLLIGRIAEHAPQSVCVIDDAQRLLPALAPLLAVLVDACCDRLRLLLAGQDLPLGLEPQIASARLVVIGHEQLAFDETEAAELAKRVGAGQDLAHAMRERTSGWAAGLMLALQLGQGASVDNAQRRLQGAFATLVQGGVLSSLTPATVKALAALAPARLIPTKLASLAAPWSDVVRELQRLSERGLFVERQPDGDLRLHDLLRNALMQEPLEDLDRDAAVSALSRIDRCELALACILVVSGCGDRLKEWLAEHGEKLLFRPDIGTLVAAVLECDSDLPPGVLLWCARGALATDLALADATAARAFLGFEATGGATGQRRCCGIGLLVQSVLLDAKRLDIWQKRLGDLPVASEHEFETMPLLEGGARLVEFSLQPWRPNTAEIQTVQEAVHRALRDLWPAQEAVLAASLAVASLLPLQRRHEAQAALAEIEDSPWFRFVPPFTEIEWYINKGFTLIGLGRTEESAASFGMAVERASGQGMRALQRSALAGLARAQLTMGSLAEAELTLAKVARLSTDVGIHRRVHELCLVAGLELSRKRFTAALAAVETAEKLLADAGASATPPLQRAKAQLLFAIGEHNSALEFSAECVLRNEGARRALAECDRLLLRSLSLWSHEPDQARADLTEGLTIAGKHRWTNYLLLLPREAGLTASRALQTGVATDVVHASIRERRLPAPADAPVEWPWPLRVYLLGEFRLERFDEPMRFQGKVQRKPLELLKYLASAREQGADHATVCDALWPDAEAGAARRNLEVATARLREMLGNAAWVKVADGRTRLDREFVWVDAQALWNACGRAEKAAKGGAQVELREVGNRLLHLYQGTLLAGDEETPWLIGSRERLSTAFVRGVRTVAEALDDSNQSELALALLARAYSCEPLAEGLAQQLMRTQLKRGQPAEAMSTYRHLRQMLSVLLGAQPSADSEHLRQSIITQLSERSTS